MSNLKSLSQAAKELNVSISKLSRLVKQGKIPSKRDPRDERVILVDVDALRKIFPPLEDDEEEEVDNT